MSWIIHITNLLWIKTTLIFHFYGFLSTFEDQICLVGRSLWRITEDTRYEVIDSRTEEELVLIRYMLILISTVMKTFFFSHRKLYSAWFLRVAAFNRCITSLWYFVIWCIQSTYSMGEEGGGVQQTRGRVCDRYRVKGIQCNSFTVRNRVRVSDSTLQKQLLKNWASTLTFSIMNDVIETVIPDSTSE